MVEYVYLSVTWPRLEVKNGHQNDICLNEIGQCSQNTKIVFKFMSHHIERAYVITQRETL